MYPVEAPYSWARGVFRSMFKWCTFSGPKLVESWSGSPTLPDNSPILSATTTTTTTITSTTTTGTSEDVEDFTHLTTPIDDNNSDSSTNSKKKVVTLEATCDQEEERVTSPSNVHMSQNPSRT